MGPRQSLASIAFTASAALLGVGAPAKAAKAVKRARRSSSAGCSKVDRLVAAFTVREGRGTGWPLPTD